jgi:tRNA threonylcarbamoyladenosine dehydratase
LIADEQRRFTSLERLYGASAIQRLRAAHVAVVGVGGVGSWAAEALVRSAIGAITLIDPDHVAQSNLNRQVHALESTLGMAKVDALGRRLLEINPALVLKAHDQALESDNLEGLLGEATVVIDAIDSTKNKAALGAYCKANNLALLMCGAAGGRTDSQALGIEDVALLKGDALLASVRYRLRKHHGFPKEKIAFGISALFSSQTALGQAPGAEHNGAALNCAGYGSSVMVTAAMGLRAAQWAVERILR